MSSIWRSESKPWDYQWKISGGEGITVVRRHRIFDNPNSQAEWNELVEEVKTIDTRVFEHDTWLVGRGALIKYRATKNKPQSYVYKSLPHQVERPETLRQAMDWMMRRYLNFIDALEYNNVGWRFQRSI